MGKCLVTKLNGVVMDDSIPRIGFLAIRPKENRMTLNVCFTEDASITTFGDAHFTNKAFTSNEGTTKNLTGYQSYAWGTTLYVQIEKEGGIMVPLYSLCTFNSNDAILDYDRFVYASKAKGLMNIYSTSNFDFASCVDGAHIDTLFVVNTKKQDISCIDKVVRIQNRLDIKNSSLYGNVSVFSKFTQKFVELDLPNTVKGELSQINSCLIAYSEEKGEYVSCSWKQTRPSTYVICGMSMVDLGNDVDKMLQDQATCVDNGQSQSWFKKIACKGNRTSASDAAVQTLQSKGYTVSITPA